MCVSGNPEDEGESFRKEIEAVIEADDLDEVLGATIDIAMAATDLDWATDCLIRLATHPNTDVRGNAMIGFAHLADRLGDLSEKDVSPVLRAGLSDPKPHVRQQAAASLDELSERLGWSSPPSSDAV